MKVEMYLQTNNDTVDNPDSLRTNLKLAQKRPKAFLELLKSQDEINLSIPHKQRLQHMHHFYRWW